MNTPDLETRLKQAMAIATPPRSIADDVMRRLPASSPKRAPRFARRHLILTTGAALTGIAATVAFIILLTGPSVRFALADVQAAVEKQKWVHIHYDLGQIEDIWTNLQSGENYFKRYDGDVGYVNEEQNIRLWYWKGSDVIEQDTPTIYAQGDGPHRWTAQSAWEYFVAPLAHVAASTQSAISQAPSVVVAQETLNGKSAIRFDNYFDGLGGRFLYSQLWADPATHLPLRVKTRLQDGERKETGKEWSTGDYDFPQTGPANLFVLGVPRDIPIHKPATTAPSDVQPILDAINRNHDNFLKNYRAAVVSLTEGPDQPQAIEIIWRDGDKVRDDHHFPDFEMQTKGMRRLPVPTTGPAAILAWADQFEASEQELINGDRTYSRKTAAWAKTAKPQIQIIVHHIRVYVDTSCWPETIQWPTRQYGFDCQRIEINADTPPGCVGLRWDDGGNTRRDYYIDPQNDYVCVKEIDWAKRSGQWTKEFDYTLAKLQRIEGRTVAGVRTRHYFGDPAKRLYPSTDTMTIDLVPMRAADYPPGTFDPASLTNGADVVGF